MLDLGRDCPSFGLANRRSKSETWSNPPTNVRTLSVANLKWFAYHLWQHRSGGVLLSAFAELITMFLDHHGRLRYPLSRSFFTWRFPFIRSGRAHALQRVRPHAPRPNPARYSVAERKKYYRRYCKLPHFRFIMRGLEFWRNRKSYADDQSVNS